MAIIGYARISTWEEGYLLDRQKEALKLAGCDQIFEGHTTGTRTDCPGLKECLDYLASGDVLVVVNPDRLGRRASELMRLVDKIESRGIGFHALNGSLDTTTPAGQVFLRIPLMVINHSG